MKKHIVSAVFLFLFSANISPAQSLRVYQDQIYQAYISGDMDMWVSAGNGLEQLWKNKQDARVLYNLLLAQYGLTGYYLGTDQKSKANEVIQKMEDYLETFLEFPEYSSQAHALQGAILGFRISIRPLRAALLGPRSMNAIDRALEEDSENPSAHLEKGNALYYAPAVFGGSKTRAITHYREAISLMEKQKNPDYRWLYLSTLASLANAYQSTDNIPMAIITINKALQAEPDFQWARDELLPSLQKKQ